MYCNVIIGVMFIFRALHLCCAIVFYHIYVTKILLIFHKTVKTIITYVLFPLQIVPSEHPKIRPVPIESKFTDLRKY